MDNFMVKYGADNTGEEMLDISIINLNDGHLYKGLVGREDMMNPVFELIYSTLEELFSDVMAEGNNSISVTEESAEFKSVMLVNIGKKAANSIMQFNLPRSRTAPIEGVDLLTMQADEIRFLKHRINKKAQILNESMSKLANEKHEVELAKVRPLRSAVNYWKSPDTKDITIGYMYNMELVSKTCTFCAGSKKGLCASMYKFCTCTGKFVAMCIEQIETQRGSLFPGYIILVVHDANRVNGVGLLVYPSGIECVRRSAFPDSFATRMHNYVVAHPQEKHAWFKCRLIIDRSSNALIAVEEKAI